MPKDLHGIDASLSRLNGTIPAKKSSGASVNSFDQDGFPLLIQPFFPRRALSLGLSVSLSFFTAKENNKAGHGVRGGKP